MSKSVNWMIMKNVKLVLKIYKIAKILIIKLGQLKMEIFTTLKNKVVII